MSKRFTDTEKWKKQFIKGLPLEYKIFWLFLLDECDNAGIWHVEIEIAEIRLGVKLSSEKARGLFGERVVVFDDGNKWFLPDFISFQYVSLNSENKALRDVIVRLQKHDLVKHFEKTKKHEKGGSEGGLNPPMDKDKDKDKEKDKEEKEETDFKKFQDWIFKNAGNVAKMKEPFTNDQYFQLREQFKNEQVKELLTAMHNYKPLLTKNISAYLTFCNWHKMRKEPDKAPVHNLPTLKTIGS